MVAKLLLSTQNLEENVVASEHQLPENLNANSFNSKKIMPTQIKQKRSTIGKEKETFRKKVEVTVEASHKRKAETNMLPTFLGLLR